MECFPIPIKKQTAIMFTIFFQFHYLPSCGTSVPRRGSFIRKILHESFFLSFTGNKTTAYAGAAVNDSLKLHAIIRFAATV